jgi:ketosteroid isomerase-like protein
MRERKALFGLCGAGTIVLSLWLWCGPSARAADEPAPTTTEFDTLLSTWLQAKATGDTKMIASYLADEFIGVGPAGRGEDKDAFLARIADPRITVQDVKTRGQTTRFYAKTAVVTGVYEIKGTSGGKDISGQYRYVDVWNKAGDRWHIIASTLSRVLD